MDEIFSAGGTGRTLWYGVLIALILGIPDVVVLFFVGGELFVILVLAVLIFGSIQIFIVAIAYYASRMDYHLGDEGLRVDFPLSPLRVGYDQVRAVGRVNTTLLVRLFGASLPGIHWGLFEARGVGRVHVYSTKVRGDFALVELKDGGRFLLSPLDVDAFVSSLRQGAPMAAEPPITLSSLAHLGRRYAVAQVVTVVLAWVLLVAYIASVYPTLPETIPVHFGLNGIPNRYGSKTEMIWLVGVASVFPTLNAVFTLKLGRYSRELTAFLGFIFVMALMLFAVVVNQIVQAA